MMIQTDAFIFTGTSFDQDGKNVIKLYGQSEKGTFVAVFDQFKNYFYVDSHEAGPLKSLNGATVKKIDVASLHELKKLKEQFENEGTRTYESDVRFLDRFLMDHELFAQINLKGEATLENGKLTFINPEIKKSFYYPKVKIFSFDIETGRDGKLLSLAYSFRSPEYSIDEVIVLATKKEKIENVYFDGNEKELLQFFQRAIQTHDPDIITGWNVVGFDLKFLWEKSKELKTPLYLGKNKKQFEMFKNARGEWTTQIEGRVVIDGPWALKMNFFSFESYKLGKVAKVVLNDAKDIDEDEAFDKWDEIERRFREDKISLAKYNLKDATLVLDIFEETKLIDLLLNRSLISGMLLDRIGGSTAAFDHFYLPALHQYNLVASNVLDVQWDKQAKGGFVLNPVTGLHDNVLVMDFKSLYPTIIQTFRIDPLSRFFKDINGAQTPVNLSFSQTHHILPQKISDLLKLRSEAKKNRNQNLSQAVKILMNSFYGVMGSSGCRFYHSDLPDAITGTGQWILKTVMEFLEEEKDLRVLYGDTDSIFVKIDGHEPLESFGKKLVVDVNDFLKDKIKKEFGLESKLEIQFDKLFKKLILTSMRGSSEGAKKRYAGLIHKLGEEPEIVLTGMEYVRSDWSLLARNFQYELVRRVFLGLEVDDYIKEFIEKLENKEFDTELVLSKNLTKPLEDYVKNIPPHVKAAKLLYEKWGRVNRQSKFVMTMRGAIPIELPCDDIDYEYYIEKQLKPVADSILNLFDKKFDQIRNHQLSLF